MNVHISPINHIPIKPQVNPSDDFVLIDSTACGNPQNASRILPNQPICSILNPLLKSYYTAFHNDRQYHIAFEYKRKAIII